MKYITSDEMLRHYIPNIITSVKGETPLFEKLTPFLDTAEAWLKQNILGEGSYETIAQELLSEEYNVVCQIVAYEAFNNAVPSLNLILTPNGFGIVSNSNVAPASAERITHLRESLVSMRDKGLQVLLSRLGKREEWLDTLQAQFFRSTLFPTLSVVRSMMITKAIWDNYLLIRQRLMEIEEKLTDTYIGSEMMEVLRQEAQTEQYRSLKHLSVIKKLRVIEIHIMKSMDTENPFDPYQAMTSVVELLKSDEEDFAEWHQSSVKELFSPPVYENSRKSNGFWF